MNHFSNQWIDEWCSENGWTDSFQERSSYWAFPPNAVMPVPIPVSVLRSIKARKGLCLEEKLWCWAAVLSAIAGGIFSYSLSSPMPAVAAFAFCAVVMAKMDDDELIEAENRS
jgi:hypothetical protein